MDFGVSEFLTDSLKKFGYFFYILNPAEHVYENVDDVKDYYKELTPLVFVITLIEYAVLIWQKKSDRHDVICNVVNGFILELGKIPTRYFAMWLYTWTYTNYRVTTLPWDSSIVWLVGFICADFMFYWLHRLSHQINILWALHETHHSPEKLNLTSAFRIHVLQLSPYWVIINPTAFFIPPTVHFVHYQFSFVFQFWLHNEHAGKFPAIIEYIFNTPSHHRVHHGRNRKYIDKNFGGVFIFWDRWFGTYEEEDPNEKVVFGTTTRITSFNPAIIQSSHFRRMWTKFREYEGISNKLSVIFKGPGWSPGKSWTGDIEDIPHPPPKFHPYNPVFPLWLEIYIITHFSLLVAIYLQVALNLQFLSSVSTFFGSIFILHSSIIFGLILDKSRYAVPLEILRCLMYFLTEVILFPEAMAYFSFAKITMKIYRLAYILSLGVWIAVGARITLLRFSNATARGVWFGAKAQMQRYWSSPIIIEKNSVD